MKHKRRDPFDPMENEFTEEVKAEARRLAGGHCLWPGCRSVHLVYHHRKIRKQGGSGVVENCAPLCDPHHKHVHDHPSEGYELGLLLHFWEEPLPWGS